jgi:hypothetical protein
VKGLCRLFDHLTDEGLALGLGWFKVSLLGFKVSVLEVRWSRRAAGGTGAGGAPALLRT